MGGGGVTQFDASYIMIMNGHENLFTIYIFLHLCYYEGNDTIGLLWQSFQI